MKVCIKSYLFSLQRKERKEGKGMTPSPRPEASVAALQAENAALKAENAALRSERARGNLEGLPHCR